MGMRNATLTDTSPPASPQKKLPSNSPLHPLFLTKLKTANQTKQTHKNREQADRQTNESAPLLGIPHTAHHARLIQQASCKQKEFQNFILGLGKSGQLSMRNAGVRSLARLSKQLCRSSSPFASCEARRSARQSNSRGCLSLELPRKLTEVAHVGEGESPAMAASPIPSPMAA
jgi:hypothetical protein